MHEEIPLGLCQCGCGKPTRIATTTNNREGWIKGQPHRFVNGHNKAKHPRKVPINGNLICSTCKAEKPTSEFNKGRATVTGFQSSCIACLRSKRLLKNYGINSAVYDEMVQRQNGVCAICLEPETHRIFGKVVPLAVDHDHETGQVRALLCHKCNRGIGCFSESPSTLRLAAEYLEAFKP